ncbi:unnamed protein product, partial [Chrysoparadoxa australica]
GTVRIWSLSQHRQVGLCRIGEKVRAIGWDGSNDGSLLAVGMGGDAGRGRKQGPKSREGYIACVRVDGLEKEPCADHAKSGKRSLKLMKIAGSEQPAVDKTLPKRKLAWISQVKFSEDGSLLAVGSHDSNIYIYDMHDCPDTID